MESLIAIASSFILTKPPLSNVWDRYKLLHIARYFLALSLYSFFFLLRILLSRFPPQSPPPSTLHLKNHPESQHSDIGDSAIARALSQMLEIMNLTHVSSRKYELVRVLAERVMDENVQEGSSEVNHAVLSSAFSRTVEQLEGSMSARGVGVRSRNSRELIALGDWQSNRIFGAVHKLWVLAGSGLREESCGAEGSGSAEKLAAELLWLARKMAECGAAEEAVSRWGSASGLASMAVVAEPRIQGSLVKVSAFLFKQAKDMEELEVAAGDAPVGQGRKMNMLMSWLPLLCHASNGTDSPVLSSIERGEMETVLEEIIEELSSGRQEKVLALWLHHFTACPNSDWPNLQACYARWYAASRNQRLLLLN